MRATGDAVLIEPDKTPEKTSGGIALPKKDESIETGIVLSIGKNVLDARGQRLEPEFGEGDRVVFRRKAFTTHEPEVFGKKRLFVRYADILSVVEDGDRNGG